MSSHTLVVLPQYVYVVFLKYVKLDVSMVVLLSGRQDSQSALSLEMVSEAFLAFHQQRVRINNHSLPL